MKPDESNDRTRREWLGVAIVTLIGAILRFWPWGRLGLTHFDEGIYALVSSWSLQPKGIAGLDPVLISYAPPGYPILGGLAFVVFGRSDVALILVSQLAGTLTIPVVAWLGRRSFGPGAGFVSAVFCALSGPQIAFSRMALTDASALLAWLVAIGAGMRFLERPGLLRALLMGLAVGLAQEFKYNGWLTGAIVVGTALLGIVIRPEKRKLTPILNTFGWGGFAAVVAWLVVWPWFAFVETHGGYSALLRHQRSYLGGFAAWWPNFLIQADQAMALSGGLPVVLPTLLLVCLTPWVARPPAWVVATDVFSTTSRLLLILASCLIVWFFVDSPYRLGLIASPWLLTRPAVGSRILGVWWLLLMVTSPFYHPYARLWLPLEASNWLMMAWFLTEAVPGLRTLDLSRVERPPSVRLLQWTYIGFVGLWIVGGLIDFASKQMRHATAQPDLVSASDSLRGACDQVSVLLPESIKELQVLVRPPVTYYLAGRVTLLPMSGSEQLRKPGRPGTWALVDSAIVRSEIGSGSEASSRKFLESIADHWEVFQEFPTILSLPTMLDLDPGAARSASADRNCPLWLLRPRRPGTAR